MRLPKQEIITSFSVFRVVNTNFKRLSLFTILLLQNISISRIILVWLLCAEAKHLISIRHMPEGQKSGFFVAFDRDEYDRIAIYSNTFVAWLPPGLYAFLHA